MTTNNTAFKTKEISANSRLSVKIGESYFTFEASETRTVDYSKLSQNLEEAENQLKEEWSALFDTVNEKVDKQAEELRQYIKTKK